MRAKRRQGATVLSSGRVFNDWLSRARADIALLTTELADRPLSLCRHPLVLDGVRPRRRHLGAADAVARSGLARGVLAFLAQHQATETSPFSDSQPGKIMHETRKGEMAVLRELPFGRYYGGVDTTPLYIYLACAYAARTGDMAFIDTLWPSLCRRGRVDGGGGQAGRQRLRHLPARRRIPASPTRAGRTASIPSSMPTAASPKGRSRWSRCRAMSLPPIGGWPIWRARAARSRQRRALGRPAPRACGPRSNAIVLDGGRRLLCAGDRRRRRALPGAHVQCRASALCRPAVAGAGADASPTSCWPRPFHSGWGVRTLADDELPFNPMSYHNGSIWPHDTAICGDGHGALRRRATAWSG